MINDIIVFIYWQIKRRGLPNCIELMPNAVHIGSKIGVKIRIAGVTSIKMFLLQVTAHLLKGV